MSSCVDTAQNNRNVTELSNKSFFKTLAEPSSMTWALIRHKGQVVLQSNIFVNLTLFVTVNHLTTVVAYLPVGVHRFVVRSTHTPDSWSAVFVFSVDSNCIPNDDQDDWNDIWHFPDSSSDNQKEFDICQHNILERVEKSTVNSAKV